MNLFTTIYPYIVTVMVGFVGYKLQQTDKKADASRANKQAQDTALNEAVCALLRDKLLYYHKHYVEEIGEIPNYAYESFIGLRDTYYALGGNGMIKKMCEEIEELEFKKRK